MRHAGTRVFEELRVADVCDPGLPPARYDLVTTCLVDEHLPSLVPLRLRLAPVSRVAGDGHTTCP